MVEQGRVTGSSVCYHGDTRFYVVLANPREPHKVDGRRDRPRQPGLAFQTGDSPALACDSGECKA